VNPCSMVLSVHAEGPPVGLVDVNTFPLKSAVTQSEVVGHEIVLNALLGSTAAVLHAEGPPVGFVDVKTFPPSSTAAQNELLGHDTELKYWRGSIDEAVHAVGPPPGFVVVMSRPNSSTAAQKVVVGQETEFIELVPLTNVESCQVAGLVPGSVVLKTFPPVELERQNEVLEQLIGISVMRVPGLNAKAFHVGEPELALIDWKMSPWVLVAMQIVVDGQETWEISWCARVQVGVALLGSVEM
jgi:hypothetical protein